MGKKIKKTVFVGVSGGVDSAVTAACLKDQGYNVVGVFIRTWTPDFIDCTWRNERRDAMRVCAHLGITFLECDAEDAYKKNVADYMISEYKLGRTPNPDVMCNREVKFGIFWQYAKAHGADFIATGHYAYVTKNSFREATGGGVSFLGTPKNGVKELRENLFLLKQGQDSTKDQSYFLWTLTQEDLAHVLFPVGHLQKTEVRKLALKYKLSTAMKKDSQGVCFLGPLDMKDFLKHYIKTEKGNVLNDKDEIIGYHDGAILYTLGERHGFTITKNIDNSQPLYVISKDIENNTITVSSRQSLAENKSHSRVLCNRVNWISKIPQADKNYKAQIRYHGKYIDCRVEILQKNFVEITFMNNILVDSGQSIVVYENDICLGGCVVV